MLKRSHFRLFPAFLVSVLVFIAAQATADQWPTSHLAVSLYKLHLCSLAGWSGYWLDRALFPYSRPHQYFDEVQRALKAPQKSKHGNSSACHDDIPDQICASLDSAEWAMARRALIVVGCLICVGLGA
jgi:hypothetical protein